MFAFFQGVSVITTSLIGAVLTAAAIQPLTVGEKHRLAAYVAYLVAVDVDGDGGETVYHAGDYCPSCNPGGKPLYPQKGAGWVGDGTVFEKCAFETDDGKLACMGTGILKQVGDFEEEIVDYGIGEEVDIDIKASPLKMPGSKWNVEGRWNYDWEFIADHLRTVHDFDDVEGYSLSELEIIHSNLHNGYPPFGCVEAASSGSSSSSCPLGNCPTSGSGTVRRRGLFRR